MIARRNFLGGLAGILTAGAAPAIIHNAMKIKVPSEVPTFIELDSYCTFGRPIPNRIKTYVDPHADSGQLSGLRRYQQIDTSRGFHLYEIPLVPVGAGKHVPILVPPERRVLRFS